MEKSWVQEPRSNGDYEYDIHFFPTYVPHIFMHLYEISQAIPLLLHLFL